MRTAQQQKERSSTVAHLGGQKGASLCLPLVGRAVGSRQQGAGRPEGEGSREGAGESPRHLPSPLSPCGKPSEPLTSGGTEQKAQV